MHPSGSSLKSRPSEQTLRWQTRQAMRFCFRIARVPRFPPPTPPPGWACSSRPACIRLAAFSIRPGTPDDPSTSEHGGPAISLMPEPHARARFEKRTSRGASLGRCATMKSGTNSWSGAKSVSLYSCSSLHK